MQVSHGASPLTTEETTRLHLQFRSLRTSLSNRTIFTWSAAWNGLSCGSHCRFLLPAFARRASIGYARPLPSPRRTLDQCRQTIGTLPGHGPALVLGAAGDHAGRPYSKRPDLIIARIWTGGTTT